MSELYSAVWAPVKSTVALEDILPKKNERFAALAICSALLGVALVALLFGQAQGPQARPFVLIAATIWSLADLLTAFLLLAQFYVNGAVLFGTLAGAYATSGIMTWAYLAAFPGLFRTGPSSAGDHQVSIYMWAIWHCTFPVLVICSTLGAATFGRVTSRQNIHLVTSLIFIAPTVACIAVCALVFSFRDSLPPLALGGHFSALWTTAFVPLIVSLNVIACIALLRRRRQLTALSLWLAVAMFASTLDAVLNLSTARYTYAWDVAKVVTVFTASVVLIMILCDIVGLYGQLARVERIDVLTSLPNRRAFEEHCQFVFANASRTRGSMALILVDLDHFKRFNESHGRISGDSALRTIATELERCATRPLDLVARYDAKTFAIVVPDTPLQGVLVIAERLRVAIEALALSHEEKALESLTASIGVGYAADVETADAKALYAAADGALADAKARGRNKIMLGSTDARAFNEPQAAAVA